jgi:hypothetical protein
MSKKKVFTARNLEKWTKFTTQINDNKKSPIDPRVLPAPLYLSRRRKKRREKRDGVVN